MHLLAYARFTHLPFHDSWAYLQRRCSKSRCYRTAEQGWAGQQGSPMGFAPSATRDVSPPEASDLHILGRLGPAATRAIVVVGKQSIAAKAFQKHFTQVQAAGRAHPRSVSDGCTDSNTPAISPVAASTLAMEKTAWPFMAAVDLMFSFRYSSTAGCYGSKHGFAEPACVPQRRYKCRAGMLMPGKRTCVRSSRQGNCVVIASRRATALGIQEGGAAVRGHHKLAPKPIGIALQTVVSHGRFQQSCRVGGAVQRRAMPTRIFMPAPWQSAASR